MTLGRSQTRLKDKSTKSLTKLLIALSQAVKLLIWGSSKQKVPVRKE